MIVCFSAHGWEDLVHWQTADPKLCQRVFALIGECRRDPFRGTGKPEPLKSEWKGFWSRRINSEHRLVYRVSGSGDKQTLEIVQCRYHY